MERPLLRAVMLELVMVSLVLLPQVMVLLVQVMPLQARSHRQVEVEVQGALAVYSRLRLESSLLEEMHLANIGKESSEQ